MSYYRSDCRHYTGYKPCANQSKCSKCGDYLAEGKRILIVKLGAMGDVLRTTPILPGLKKAHPESHITWVTDERSMPILAGNLLIDRLFALNFKTYLLLTAERFDTVICLDKDTEAASFAKKISHDKYYGYHISPEGKIIVANNGKTEGADSSQYALDLGLKDALKFRKNQRSYQDIIFEQAGLTFDGEEYSFELTEEERSYGRRLLRAPGKIVGFNVGSGPSRRKRQWGERNWILLHRLLNKHHPEIKVILLGGPEERFLLSRVQYALNPQPEIICDKGIRQFAAIIAACDTIVTADTMAMHLAIAVKTPPIVLLGPTHTPEIYLYDQDTKIVSDFPCVPCFKQACDKTPGCVESISPKTVMQAIEEAVCAKID